ncbi:MAG TPA: TIR domain-containing protein [Caulobacter sp.]|nr:TIR domain-containing protein [Caulobacter sp.]
MADICIIYARSDASAIPPALEAVLKTRWSVWWDRHLVSGDYRAGIEAEVTACEVLIPIWSTAATFNAHMHDELEIARKAGVAILPVRIHAADAPMSYGSLQATEMLGWDGKETLPQLNSLMGRVRAAIEERRPDERPQRLAMNGFVDLPAFFYSVSSHETRLAPAAALRTLDMFGAETILVSAYDTGPNAPKSLIQTLERRRKRGATILLDSGNYERARRDDGDWKFETFETALRATPHDLAFAFDVLNPTGDIDKVAKAAIAAAKRTARLTTAPVIPIVHLPRRPDDSYRTEMAGPVMRHVAQALAPAMIAIPERELGSGVFERARTMSIIRKALKGLGRYQPVHVLGAGNPISLALLSAAGADCFDGLEWCRYAFDAEHAQLHHFQLFELFSYQLAVAESPVAASAALDPAVSYTTKAVMHNLDFYNTWLKELRSAAQEEKALVAFLAGLLPKGAIAQARAALPSVL